MQDTVDPVVSGDPNPVGPSRHHEQVESIGRGEAPTEMQVSPSESAEMSRPQPEEPAAQDNREGVAVNPRGDDKGEDNEAGGRRER